MTHGRTGTTSPKLVTDARVGAQDLVINENDLRVGAYSAAGPAVVANPACHGQPDSSYPILTRTCIR